MASKIILLKKRCVIITSFLVYLILFVVLSGVSQNISKQYIVSQQEDGLLYFINPQEGWNSKKVKAELIYDITYNTSNDSLVFNFSLLTKQNIYPEGICVINGSDSLSSQVNKIYIDTQKSKYHYRYTTIFTFDDYYTLIKHDTSQALIIIYLKNNDPVVLTISKNQWLKQRDILVRIFNLIALNKDSV
ncbi:MAG: hypothetical protein U9R60_02080 [Bacteroidota bacterium]|nr:hypothetical protein [Bacteroidota bacterium]